MALILPVHPLRFLHCYVKRSVPKLTTKPKNESEDEIGRFSPSDWLNREKKAQETGCDRSSF